MGHTLHQPNYKPSCKVPLYLSSVKGEKLWRCCSEPATLAPPCLKGSLSMGKVSQEISRIKLLPGCLDMFAFDKSCLSCSEKTDCSKQPFLPFLEAQATHLLLTSHEAIAPSLEWRPQVLPSLARRASTVQSLNSSSLYHQGRWGWEWRGLS